MNEHLEKACDALGITADQVLAWNVNDEDNEIVLVVDEGIAGCPKYRLSLSPMQDTQTAQAESVESEPAPQKRKPNSPLEELETVDLRAMAKELGIKPYWNMRRDTLIERLSEVYGE